MATIAAKLIPLPKPEAVLIDKNGLPTKDFYDWLVRLQAVLGTLSALGNFANDAAAATGGVAIGGLYRNGSVVQIRVT